MRVLILDDSHTNLALIANVVGTGCGCECETAADPLEALGLVARSRFDLMIVDYVMPGMNGVEFIGKARALPGYANTPIIMVTTMDARELRNTALQAGATDFVSKPFDIVELRARVRNMLAIAKLQNELRARAEGLQEEVSRATSTIAEREHEVILRLSRAAEHRDTDTGDHLNRVSGYTRAIALELGHSQSHSDLLALASTMHDIGKIAISDAILQKPGPLTPEERAIITGHATFGHEILDGSNSELIQLAAEIALSHHERWDGKGYPHALAGEDIPLPGRIVAVADVFDALISDRPYKSAWSLEKARDYISENAGTQFDPACAEAFAARFEEIRTLALGHNPERPATTAMSTAAA